MAQQLDSRCILHPARLVPGVATKTRLESSIQTFKPHVIYDCRSGHAVKAEDAERGFTTPPTEAEDTWYVDLSHAPYMCC
jgi:hypothetical protein